MSAGFPSPETGILPPAQEPRLPLILQFAYAVGEIPITATMGLFGVFVLFFYHSVMGLPGSLAGLGVTAGLVADAILDPYIGYRSDRSRSLLGRRQSFMLFGSLAAGPLFYFLMSPPRGLGQAGLFLWLLFFSVTFRFFMACYRIPYLSLGAELTSDYNERTRVIAIRALLGLGGMLAGSALPFVLFFPGAGEGGDPKLHYEGYPRMGLFFAAVMALSGLVAVFGTLSRRSFAEPAAGVLQARRFYSGMWLLLGSRQFRILWIAFLLCTLSVVLNFTLAVPFYKWYAQVPESGQIGAVQASFYAGAVAGVLAWIWVSRHGEKRNWLAASIACLAGVLCCATLLIGDQHLLGTGNARALLVGNVVAGLFASALWVLPFSMMADVVDEDELRSGLRREGVCFGLMNLGEKVAAGGALLISGVLLDVFVRLAPGSEVQTPQAASRLGLVYGLLPGLILASSSAIILTYRLTRPTVRQIQEKLRARRLNGASITAVRNAG